MILVDKRIGSSFTSEFGKPFDILKALKDRTNGNADTTTLDSGDFAFEGNGPSGVVYVGIERKALADAIGSMRTDRYAGEQAKRMCLAYDIAYLVVEGQYRPSASGTLEFFGRRDGKWGWHTYSLAAKGPASRIYYQYSELDKHIVSMENKKNVVLVRSGSVMETVWQIVNRYQWWQKEWDAHQSCDPIKMQSQVIFEEVTMLRTYLAQLPGIGWKKSKGMAEYFRTIQNMANAAPSEWREAGASAKQVIEYHAIMRKVFGR